jgi:hypothetical protein
VPWCFLFSLSRHGYRGDRAKSGWHRQTRLSTIAAKVIARSSHVTALPDQSRRRWTKRLLETGTASPTGLIAEPAFDDDGAGCAVGKSS